MRDDSTAGLPGEHYGDRVRIVVRMNPLPFHDEAMPAAEAAMAAHAQGRFWPMHDALFESQRSLDRATLERLAQRIGLDVQRFRRDLDRHTFRAQIEAQQRAAFRAPGARGTPSFFVGIGSMKGVSAAIACWPGRPEGGARRRNAPTTKLGRDLNELVKKVKSQVDAAIKEHRIKPSDGMRLLGEYERGLRDQTYLSLG